MTQAPCTGLVLAGGRSSRMGGGFKALAGLNDRPMIGYVIERLQTQVAPLMLSVDHAADELAALGLPMIEDLLRSHRGPLTGLYSGLKHFETPDGVDWLLLCPCDAPFVPDDLAVRLLAAAHEQGCDVAIAEYEGHPQPTFSVWRRAVLPAIEAAVLEKGRGGLMQMLDEISHARVAWATQGTPPFFNVNTPADLEQARQWM